VSDGPAIPHNSIATLPVEESLIKGLMPKTSITHGKQLYQVQMMADREQALTFLAW
jgi:hypothetical protein